MLAAEAMSACNVLMHRSCLLRLPACTLQQEFQAEQDYMKTLSYLSPEEQKKYKERQSVSWLYQKPPGMDAADKPKVTHLRTCHRQNARGCAASNGMHCLCRMGRLIRAQRQS